MNTINGLNGNVDSQRFAALALRQGTNATPLALKGWGEQDASSAIPFHGSTHTSEDLREAFTQFAGEMFYGQMLKAMRQTVGKPAYFHGGRGEEAFQSQLDQTMTEELTKASASKFADPMFERQFPGAAKTDRMSGGLGQLDALSRR